ncbi:hypothetical protein HDU96_006196 [Phlyctochytrium bullatum]|nr:hypothetical protein HDU96_006196 [Phlyctochytrium bullatum]
MRQQDDAINAWKKSIEMDPNLVDAHVNLANVLMLTQKQPEAAIEHYKKAILLNPKDGEVQFNYGCALDSLGRLDAAIEQYEQALANGIERAEKNLRNAKAKALSAKVKS